MMLLAVSGRNCFPEEARVQSQAVPGRRLDLIVARGLDEEARALSLVQTGELSAARQALEGASPRDRQG